MQLFPQHHWCAPLVPCSPNIIVQMYAKFLMQKADSLDLLRRIPVKDYDISFLVTRRHITQLGAPAITHFICSFASKVPAGCWAEDVEHKRSRPGCGM